MADDSPGVPVNANLPSAWERVVDRFIEGGIPQAIAGQAGAAISRLIAGVADIPAAWLERRAQSIRDETSARSAVIKDLAAATGTAVAADRGIVDRSIDRWLGTQFRKQENVEAIAVKTIEYLQEEPPPAQATTGPSDDFMNLFGQFAENASSESLRDMFARVLAGEIRKPGSFSLRTLQFVSIMDQQLAAAVMRVRPWISINFIVLGGDFAEGAKLNIINLLSDVGLLRIGMYTRKIIIDDNGRYVLNYKKRGIVIHGASGESLEIDVALLTPVGLQVMSLVDPEDNIEELMEIARLLKDITGVIKVEIADITPVSVGRASIHNPLEV